MANYIEQWKSIYNSEEYKSKPIEERERLKNQFFDLVITPSLATSKSLGKLPSASQQQLLGSLRDSFNNKFPNVITPEEQAQNSFEIAKIFTAKTARGLVSGIDLLSDIAAGATGTKPLAIGHKLEQAIAPEEIQEKHPIASTLAIVPEIAASFALPVVPVFGQLKKVHQIAKLKDASFAATKLKEAGIMAKKANDLKSFELISGKYTKQMETVKKLSSAVKDKNILKQIGFVRPFEVKDPSKLTKNQTLATQIQKYFVPSTTVDLRSTKGVLLAGAQAGIIGTEYGLARKFEEGKIEDLDDLFKNTVADAPINFGLGIAFSGLARGLGRFLNKGDEVAEASGVKLRMSEEERAAFEKYKDKFHANENISKLETGVQDAIDPKTKLELDRGTIPQMMKLRKELMEETAVAQAKGEDISTRLEAISSMDIRIKNLEKSVEMQEYNLVNRQINNLQESGSDISDDLRTKLNIATEKVANKIMELDEQAILNPTQYEMNKKWLIDAGGTPNTKYKPEEIKQLLKNSQKKAIENSGLDLKQMDEENIHATQKLLSVDKKLQKKYKDLYEQVKKKKMTQAEFNQAIRDEYYQNAKLPDQPYEYPGNKSIGQQLEEQKGKVKSAIYRTEKERLKAEQEAANKIKPIQTKPGKTSQGLSKSIGEQLKEQQAATRIAIRSVQPLKGYVSKNDIISREYDDAVRNIPRLQESSEKAMQDLSERLNIQKAADDLSLTADKTVDKLTKNNWLKEIDNLPDAFPGLMVNPYPIVKQLKNIGMEALDTMADIFRLRQPVVMIERFGAPTQLTRLFKTGVVETKRYIEEVHTPHFNLLAKLNLTPEQYMETAQMLDTLPGFAIDNLTDNRPVVKAAKIMRSFFAESAKRAGLPEERYLSAYFPHIDKLDPEYAKFLSDYIKKGSAFFMHTRNPNSQLQNFDLIEVMRAYSAGTRRMMMKRVADQFEAARRGLQDDNPLVKYYDQIIDNINRIQKPTVLDHLKANLAQNILRFNVQSSLLNATQTLTTLLPEVGVQNYSDSLSLMRNVGVSNLIRKLITTDDYLERFGIYAEELQKRNRGSLASVIDFEKLKTIDLFKNVELRNRKIAGIAAMIKQSGGKGALLKKLQAGLTRDQENELLIAAQDMIEKTQFAPNVYNKSRFQSDPILNHMLFFQTIPAGEVGLTWGWLNLMMNPMTAAAGFTALTYYHLTKTMLAGDDGATVLVPGAAWWMLERFNPQMHDALKDKIQVMDEFNIPKKVGIDYSLSMKSFDLTDADTWTLYNYPLVRGATDAIQGGVDLMRSLAGDLPDVRLTEEEKLLPESEKAKIIALEHRKRIIKDITKVATAAKPPPALRIGNTRLEIGAGQYGKLARLPANIESKRNVLYNIPLPTDVKKEVTRFFGPSDEDTARIRVRREGLLSKYKDYLKQGKKPPAWMLKELKLAGYEVF